MSTATIHTPTATHVAERARYWNVSAIEDRIYRGLSGLPRGWQFVTGSNGTSKYLLRIENGVMTARTYKVVPVETKWGERCIRPTARFTLIDHTLPEDGNVIVVGKRVGSLSWFGGTPEYDGSNIDGGVIWKVYVSGPHRRKGVASAMFDLARSLYPDKDIRHSNALTPDGAAFAAATPTANDIPVRRIEGARPGLPVGVKVA